MMDLMIKNDQIAHGLRLATCQGDALPIYAEFLPDGWQSSLKISLVN
jgi:hypothetical protein